MHLLLETPVLALKKAVYLRKTPLTIRKNNEKETDPFSLKVFGFGMNNFSILKDELQYHYVLIGVTEY